MALFEGDFLRVKSWRRYWTTAVEVCQSRVLMKERVDVSGKIKVIDREREREGRRMVFRESDNESKSKIKSS